MQLRSHQIDWLLVKVNAPNGMQVHQRVQHKQIVTFVATQIPQGLTQSLLFLLVCSLGQPSQHPFPPHWLLILKSDYFYLMRKCTQHTSISDNYRNAWSSNSQMCDMKWSDNHATTTTTLKFPHWEWNLQSQVFHVPKPCSNRHSIPVGSYKHPPPPPSTLRTDSALSNPKTNTAPIINPRTNSALIINPWT